VEQWLKQLDLAPKTKGHLQNLMRLLVNCAMRWELVGVGANPMKLVRVRGGSKRTKEPRVLTIPQFQQLVKELNDPYRTMVLLDLATGLHCSELFALKWCDVIWDDLTLLVRRAIVDTVESDVKTVYSRAGMPLDIAPEDFYLVEKKKVLVGAVGIELRVKAERGERCVPTDVMLRLHPPRVPRFLTCLVGARERSSPLAYWRARSLFHPQPSAAA